MKGPGGRRSAGRRLWCSWHRGLSDTARLVQAHEAATGPGGNLYACAKCRETFALVPLAERTI